VVVSNGACASISAETIIKIASPPVPVMPYGTIKTCPGVKVALSVSSNPGLLFQWNNSSGIIPGATNASYSTSLPGNYFATLSDVLGCSFNSNIAVLQNYPAATAAISISGSTNLCVNGVVLLKAKVKTGYSYEWYLNNAKITGATASTYSATVPGSYKYKATTSTGCTAFSKVKNIPSCKNVTDTSIVSGATLVSFPNPSGKKLTVRMEDGNGHSGKGLLQVTNSIGQVIAEKNCWIQEGLLVEEIILPDHIASGLFTILLQSGELVLTTRHVLVE
jgi:hypothetical protein